MMISRRLKGLFRFGLIALVITGFCGSLPLLGFVLNPHEFDELALRAAAGSGDKRLVEYLLDDSANIHADEDQALRLAAANNKVDIVRILLDHGANVHAHHDQALGVAAMKGYTTAAEILINRGADIRGCKGIADFQLAVLGGDTELADFIRERMNPKTASCY